ncbi:MULTISPECIES: MFS transporter [unclassified Leclercia]|uniref:MFS transporter n=1 Tax=Leclercia barmai TaxID=2785629 RepID=A0ABS7RYX7_9ENTR|nr:MULTISPECIES: MFS transporter [unclassified Leclercia]MBZ0059518.1 MFS transporter [Leclercia sp. EMC7]MCM5697350.1 MFS transporter [Leclercia sp. LTM01]MCM5702055.1 MFS transporter [Leclercia sp. LTM14]
MLSNIRAAEEDAADTHRERKRTFSVVVVSIAMVLEIVDVSILNVAVPVLQKDLHASGQQIEWIFTGYLFFFSVLLLTGGRLGDLFGYRRLFMGGLLLFGVASAGCGLAVSPEMLIAMRILQGISGAMMGPQILSLVQVLYPPHERFNVMSIFGILGGAAGVLGPILGGAIIEYDFFGLSWRPVFLINIPVVAVALVLAWRVLPDVRSPHARKVDLTGTLLAVTGGGLLLFTLVEAPALKWPWWISLMPLISLLLLAALWQHLKRRTTAGDAALFPPFILRDRFFVTGLTITLLYQLATASLLLATSLVLQNGLGLSPLHTALMHVPFALGAAFSIAVAGRRLVARLGRNIAPIGVGVQLTALLLMGTGVIFAASPTGLVLLGCGFGLCGCGMGLVSAPLPAFAMARVPVAHAGAASGLFRTGQQFGAALGMATLGGFYLTQIAVMPELWSSAFISLLGMNGLVLLIIALLSRGLPEDVHRQPAQAH